MKGLSRASTVDTETTDEICHSLERNKKNNLSMNDMDNYSNQIVQNPQYGGPFIWKVDRIALRVFEAKSGKVRVMFFEYKLFSQQLIFEV